MGGKGISKGVAFKESDEGDDGGIAKFLGNVGNERDVVGLDADFTPRLKVRATLKIVGRGECEDCVGRSHCSGFLKVEVAGRCS